MPAAIYTMYNMGRINIFEFEFELFVVFLILLT